VLPLNVVVLIPGTTTVAAVVIGSADYDEMCCARILRGFCSLQESIVLNRRGSRISISARDDSIGIFGDLLR
jgi:hypothetical protein